MGKLFLTLLVLDEFQRLWKESALARKTICSTLGGTLDSSVHSNFLLRIDLACQFNCFITVQLLQASDYPHVSLACQCCICLECPSINSWLAASSIEQHSLCSPHNGDLFEVRTRLSYMPPSNLYLFLSHPYCWIQILEAPSTKMSTVPS